MPQTELCPCGRPLHYADPFVRSSVERIIRARGGPHPHLIEVYTEDGAWLVPLHYLALHGIHAVTLPELAKDLGFEKIPPLS